MIRQPSGRSVAALVLGAFNSGSTYRDLLFWARELKISLRIDLKNKVAC